MSNETGTDSLISRTAMDVLTFARSTLMVRLRFLDAALSRLETVQRDGAAFATDGARLEYDPRKLLMSFRNDRERPSRDYLHTILHCVYSHMFTGAAIDRRLWDLACDIAAESTINDLRIYDAASQREAAQAPEIGRLRDKLGFLTAEKIYRHYRETGIPQFESDRLSLIFQADDHSVWYVNRKDLSEEKTAADGSSDMRDCDSSDAWEETSDTPEAEEERSLPLEELAEEWRKIADRIREDLGTFSRERGDSAGTLVQNLCSVTREKYDYADFLRKFAVPGECMTVNDEEFDYIFYTYGLELYGNMPLVEPLEYKEVRRIREFVIAIDTSGSTSGELVQNFLRKTYNILKTTESYFSHINVHIIQCDADIQEHAKITSEDEFDSLIRTMVIRGQGGTDFRPVFRLVDSLIEEGELTDLRGLIYFTDGRGVYPSRRPGYDTAFVFLDNDYDVPEVPPWAIRLVLQDEDIQAENGMI